jgi:hypothetical protein
VSSAPATTILPLVCALLGFAANSCSLLGLDDLDIGVCARNAAGPSACQALDARDHIAASACRHWQCRTDGQPGCELRVKDSDADGYADSQVCNTAEAPKQDCDDANPDRFASNPERCDGIDNDCDGVIDEGVLGPDTLAAPASQFDIGNLHLGAGADLVAVDQSPQRSLDSPLLRLSANGDAWLFDPASAALAQLQYASSNPDDDNRPCRKIGASWIGCNMRQLATSRGASYLVGASIVDDADCNDGELRIGVAAAAEWPPKLYLGAAREDASSNLEYGVDVSADASCPLGGVRAPAIASIDTPNASQGLAVWLNDPVEASDACATDRSIDVRAIGFWVVTGQRPILRASASGTSQQVGASRGGGAPALLGVGSGLASPRYLLGYGDAAGGLRLAGFSALSLNPATGEATDPLPAATLFELLEPERSISHVALAASSLQPSAASVRLAAVYRTGCDAAADIELSRFDWNGNDPPRLRARVGGLARRSDADLHPERLHCSRGRLARQLARSGQRPSDPFARDAGDRERTLTGPTGL